MRQHESLIAKNNGFTLIEVMVAAVILTIALIPLAGIINRGSIASQQAQERIVAMSVATEYMEAIKSYLPKSPYEFTPTNPHNNTLGDIIATDDSPEKVTKQMTKSLTKDFYRYVTVNQPAVSTTSQDGTFYKMTVTVTVYWQDNWSNTRQEINITTEMVGR